MKKSGRPAPLNSRLAAYSATAAAVILTAPLASAGIQNITSATLNLNIPVNDYLPTLTVTFGPSNEFNFAFTASNQQFTGFTVAHASLRGGLFAWSEFNYVAKDFAPGELIAGPFDTNGILAKRTATANWSGPQGHFQPGPNGVHTGYIGFKTNNVNGAYYGWMRVKITGDANGNPSQISLVSVNGAIGAFGLVSDGITAGQLSAVPEPAHVATGLALFALGAAGVREHRRRRATLAI